MNLTYSKNLQKHLLVESCKVHGFHVHPRKLDGTYIEMEAVTKLVDRWLDLRRRSVSSPSDKELGVFAEIRNHSEKYVQFKILLSELAEQNYRQIGSSSKVASVILAREATEGLHAAAARYIEGKYSAEQVEAASVRQVDPADHCLQRIERDSESSNADEAKDAIDAWLNSRAHFGSESTEVLSALTLLQQRCAQSACFQLCLTRLYEQNYSNIGDSQTVSALALQRTEGKSLASAAAHASGAPKFSHTLYGNEATGEYIFIIKNRQLYVATKTDDIQHTSFFGAHESVESSGWLRLHNGSIVGYQRWSGHFLPGEGSEGSFRTWVAEHGLKLQARDSGSGLSDWLDVELCE